MNSLSWRDRALESLARDAFDILVIGGGITGAAIARQASLRGLSVALVERGDFAGGTSGRSSRLIHGGLRYVKQGRLTFVRKSIRAQAELARVAPRLVRPISFLTALYSDGPYPAGPVLAVMGLFRAAHSGIDRLPYENLDEPACRAREPLLRADHLLGGYAYREYLTHDARLVVETVLAARDHGAVALSYAAAEELLVAGGHVAGARVRDQLSGATIEVRARAVVNAAGPWADCLASDCPIRLSKGIHAVISRERAPLSEPLVVFSPRDARAVFAIPMERFVLLGTTETEHSGTPDEAAVESDDVAYLLQALEHTVPLGLGPGDVVDAWAAVRPLLGGWRDPGKLSRDYVLVRGGNGLLSILGGKLTLHRQVAEDALAALGVAAGRAPDPPLPGETWPVARPVLERALAELVGESSASHLVSTYGGRAAEIFARLEADTESRALVAPGLPHVRAELDHAIEEEMAVFADDFARRRTDFAIEARAMGIDPAAALTPSFAAFVS
jgi:glycerol-3-phosphate dehydrogenase